MLYINPYPVLSALLLPKIFLIESQDERKYLPYPLMLVNRAICGFLGSKSAILRSSAVQRYIPERLRSRVNALNSVLLTTGASVFSLLMGFLGEVLDYRWCVTFGGAATLLACHFLIGGRRQDVRKVYEAG